MRRGTAQHRAIFARKKSQRTVRKKNAAKMPVNSASLFRRRCAEAASKRPPQMHHARTLLSLLPLLDRQYFSQAVTRLHNSHPVEGAASVSWICSCMARVLPPKEKRQMLERADRFMAESVGMRKIGKLWSSESAWEAVHGEPPRTLPRYHSAESFFLPFSNGPTSAGQTS